MNPRHFLDVAKVAATGCWCHGSVPNGQPVTVTVRLDRSVTTGIEEINNAKSKPYF